MYWLSLIALRFGALSNYGNATGTLRTVSRSRSVEQLSVRLRLGLLDSVPLASYPVLLTSKPFSPANRLAKTPIVINLEPGAILKFVYKLCGWNSTGERQPSTNRPARRRMSQWISTRNLVAEHNRYHCRIVEIAGSHEVIRKQGSFHEGWVATEVLQQHPTLASTRHMRHQSKACFRPTVRSSTL